jgi:hypothetical protein
MFVIASGITDVTSGVRIKRSQEGGFLSWGRNHMSFSEELFAEAVHMLQDCCTRRTGTESMSNGIPRNVDLVADTLIVKMENKLLCHARAFGRVSKWDICIGQRDSRQH